MSKQLNDHSSGDSQLSSDAEAYVLGCLDNDARDAFESQLATNQLAREALAEAVEHVGAARVALQDTADASDLVARSQDSRHSNLSSQAPSGIAGLLVLAVFFCLRLNWPVESSPEPESNDRLALIWSDMISEAEDSIAPLATSMEETQDVTEDSEYLVADSPDWMLAAVGQLSKRDDMLHERDMENR